MMRVIFLGLVVLDLLRIVLLFVLVLAAAGSTNRPVPGPRAARSPRHPTRCVGDLVHMRHVARRTFGRVAPRSGSLLILVFARAIVDVQGRTTTNESGEMTFFRSGQKREMSRRSRGTTRALWTPLLSTVDVNDTGVPEDEVPRTRRPTAG